LEPSSDATGAHRHTACAKVTRSKSAENLVRGGVGQARSLTTR